VEVFARSSYVVVPRTEYGSARTNLSPSRSFVAMLSGDWAGADWDVVRIGGRL